MEERIITYSTQNDIEPLICILKKKSFLLVHHNTTTHQLHFKKMSASLIYARTEEY